MRVAPILRALTPVGWIAAVVGVVVAAGLVLGGLGFRWDPFDLSRRRAKAAEAASAAAQSELATRMAESQGQAGQVARLDAAFRTTRSLDRATSLAIQEARTADDTDAALSLDRADRLRDHDRELCRIAPDLGGCAAPPDAALDGDKVL